jgi:hypothetical protein
MRSHGLMLLARTFMVGAAIATYASAQDPPQEQRGLSIPEAKGISPFPPPLVRVRIGRNATYVSWHKVVDPSVVGYVVYRRLPSGRFEELSRTTDNRFVDRAAEARNAEYAVASVNRFGVVGRSRVGIVN